MNSSEVSAETLALYQKYHEESRRNAALKADNAKVILLKEYEEISNFISDIENKRDEVERHCTLSLNADRSDKKNIIIPSNPYLDSLIQTVTDHICKLLNCYRDLKIWIQYHVPALTDGADFRIPVIEDVLSMITNVEGSSSGFLSNGIDYHLKRAGIVKILRSFPQHEDAKAALSHHDNKSFTDPTPPKDPPVASSLQISKNPLSKSPIPDAGLIKPKTFTSTIVYEYRAYRYPIPETIGQFCFPEDKVYPTPHYAPNDLFCFVLTTQSNVRRYCFALRFTVSDTRPPDCLCLVSPFYWPNGPDSEPIQLSLVRPDETLGFSSQRNMRVLFDYFSADEIVELHLWIMLERGVLVLGHSLDDISTICECLVGILYPFEWKHVFVSILPYSMRDYIAAPMPFIMGTLHNNLERFSSTVGDICVCDISAKRILYPKESVDEIHNSLSTSPAPSTFWGSRSQTITKPTPPIEQRPTHAHVTSMRMLNTLFTTTPPFKANSFSAASRLTESLASLVKAETNLQTQTSASTFSVRVLHLFFAFHASLLNGYKASLRPNKLDLNLLVSMSTSDVEPFLRQFVETRMCVEFSDVLLNNQPSAVGKGPDVQIGQMSSLRSANKTTNVQILPPPSFVPRTQTNPLAAHRKEADPSSHQSNPFASPKQSVGSPKNRPSRSFSVSQRKDRSNVEVWVVTLLNFEIDAQLSKSSVGSKHKFEEVIQNERTQKKVPVIPPPTATIADTPSASPLAVVPKKRVPPPPPPRHFQSEQKQSRETSTTPSTDLSLLEVTAPSVSPSPSPFDDIPFTDDGLDPALTEAFHPTHMEDEMNPDLS